MHAHLHILGARSTAVSSYLHTDCFLETESRRPIKLGAAADAHEGQVAPGVGRPVFSTSFLWNAASISTTTPGSAAGSASGSMSVEGPASMTSGSSSRIAFCALHSGS